MLTLAEFVLVLCSDGKKSGGGGARKKNRKQKKGTQATSKTSIDAVEAVVGDRRPSGTATQVSETNDVATDLIHRSIFRENVDMYRFIVQK